MARPRRPNSDASGFSVLELLFVVSLMATVGGIALPPLLAAADDLRARSAARYVATRLQRAHIDAVLRSADVSLRFTQTSTGYAFATYLDGNRNGVLSADILHGVDTRLGGEERLPDHFAGVDFGTIAGLPPVDSGGTPPGSDPIRLGASDGATFTAAGTSSTGSLYIRGVRNQQYVVRIFGDTGRTRMLLFDQRSRTWKPL